MKFILSLFSRAGNLRASSREVNSPSMVVIPQHATELERLLFEAQQKFAQIAQNESRCTQAAYDFVEHNRSQHGLSTARNNSIEQSQDTVNPFLIEQKRLRGRLAEIAEKIPGIITRKEATTGDPALDLKLIMCSMRDEHRYKAVVDLALATLSHKRQKAA